MAPTLPPPKPKRLGKTFSDVLTPLPSKQAQQIAELQDELAQERDARKEDRFVFIVVLVILLDVVFFSVVDSVVGPLALLILELLVLIPLAKRLGMEEIAKILDRVVNRVAGKNGA